MFRAYATAAIISSLVVTSTAQVQFTPTARTSQPQGKTSQRTPVNQLPDSELEKYVGFEGAENKVNPEDTNLALGELASRANSKRDGRAAFLVGRGYQVPANSAIKTNPENAVKWFRYGTALGDIAATDAYSMCLRMGYGGVPVNTAQADELSKWAMLHGYSGMQDRQGVDYNQRLYDERHRQQDRQPQEIRPPASHTASAPNGSDLLLGAMAAIVGLAALTSASSNTKGNSGSSSTPQAYTPPKSCTIPETVRNIDGSISYQGSRTGYGYECP